ncbi:hypothetical protein BDW66DRAFT_127128 [Aspergillus desertorum]
MRLRRGKGVVWLLHVFAHARSLDVHHCQSQSDIHHNTRHVRNRSRGLAPAILPLVVNQLDNYPA